MCTMIDAYPSRTDQKLPLYERQDPVVYAESGEHIGPLSVDALNSFEEKGFLVLDALFDDSEIRRFREELERLSRLEELQDKESVIREPDSHEVRSIFEIHKVSSLFQELAADPRILDRIRQILASDVYIHQSRINYKPGFKGKGFNWHSDFETWHAEDGMPSMRAVSCSILLTDNFGTNGPLMLVPGSHKVFVPCVGLTPEDNYKSSLKDQQIGVPDTDSLAQLIHAGGIETFTGRAGTMLLFDCNTLHGSNANMSPYPRSNVFFVYNSVDNAIQKPFAAKRPRPAFLAEREAVKPLRRAA